MSLNVKYKANKFLSNLESLESFLEYLSKLSSLHYEETGKVFTDQQSELVFYPSFYVERVKKLKTSFKKFFDANDITLPTLSDFYNISIDFKSNLEISDISVYIEDITENVSLKKGLKFIHKNAFHKDVILINYLIELEDGIGEKHDLHWIEWIKKYTKSSMVERRKRTEIPGYSDACFGDGIIDYILKKEISELDKLAYNLQKEINADFDSFIESNPLTYIDNKLTENAEKQLKELSDIKNRKGLKFSDKLILLSDKVDGSKESIDLILQNLTLENFKSVLEQILKCLPGVLSIQELIEFVLEGSFELITQQFLQDILLLLPPEFRNQLDSFTEVQFPWLDGSSEFSLIWFEVIFKHIDMVLKRFGFPSFFDIYFVLTAKDFPSSMYEVMKLNFPGLLPDLDFKLNLPIEQTLEEYLVLVMSPPQYSILVQNGDENNEVLKVQKELNKKNYTDSSNKPLDEDGKFGAKTGEAVRKFQNENTNAAGEPLDVDGKVGEETWYALFLDVPSFDLFTTDKTRYELLLLEIIDLRAKLIELGFDSPIPAFNIPSFANFRIPNIPFPNFKNRELTIGDYQDLYVFLKIYFPEYKLPSFSIEIPQGLDINSLMPNDMKKLFFKDLYYSVLEISLDGDIKLKNVFDDIFFNIKLISEPYSGTVLLPPESSFFSKLFTMKFCNKLPDMALQFPDLDGANVEQIIFDAALKIPQIKQLFDILSPELRSLASVDGDFLNFQPPNFDLSNFKLPEIPKIPSIKFNFVDFLAEKFFQMILKIIIKTFLTLLARALDKLTLEFCADPQEGGLSNNEPDGGLKTLVGEIACPDKDAAEQSFDLIGKTLKSMANVEQNNNAITRIVEALSVCTTVNEIAPAILGDKEKINPGFLNGLSDVMNAVVPEYADVIGTPEKLSEMFERAGNLLNEQQRDSLENFVNEIPVIEVPINNTICLEKESLQEWQQEREQLFIDSGFDPDIAKQFVEKQRQRAKEEIRDIVNLAIKTPEDIFSEALDDILSPDGINEDCEDPKRPKELEEKINQFSNDLLNSINTLFVEDMLKPNFFFGPYKGAVSKILSDKHDRPMSDITTIKENFFLNLLVSFDLLPEPEFPDTILKDLSESLKNLQYSYNEQVKTTPAFLDKPLFKLPILNKVKYSVSALNYKTPDLTLSYDKNRLKPAEYMDYMYEDPLFNGLKIGLDFIKPRNVKKQEFLEKFSSFGFNENTTPKQIFAFLHGVDYEEEYEIINEKVFSYMKETFSEEAKFGYPTEIKDTDIELSNGDNESKTLAELVNPNDRVEVLDPEIYGGSYENPNIFIRPPDASSIEGYYSYSKKLFSKKSQNKLDSTILNLSQVSDYIQKSKNKIDQRRYEKAKGVEDEGDILEKPYSIMLPKDKVANVWGNIKILIRIYLSEFFTLGYPVVKKLGMKYENYGDLLFSYIEHRISKDMHEIKNLGDPKSIYAPYIIYILLLESIGIKYMTEKKNDLSDFLQSKKEEYESLLKDEIDFIKSVTHNSISLALFPKLDSYVKGFAAFSFHSNWFSVLDSTLGFNINSFNLDEKEIRLASKLGYVLNDLQLLRDILKENIIEEAKFYENEFAPEIENIYLDFITSQNGLGVDLTNIGFDHNYPEYYIKKYIKITDKQDNEIITDYDGLLGYIENIPDHARISSVLGNAFIEDIYEKKYGGTIGIKLGLSFGYKDVEISSYEKDMKDLLIGDLKTIGENLGEDIGCYSDELFKTPKMELLLKHCLKVEKAGSLAGIYFMKNAISSLGEGQNERALSFELPFGGIVESIIQASSPDSIYTTTKKEVLRNIQSYLYDESRDPKQDNPTFSDFKKKEIINENYDSKNLKIKDSGAIPFFSRSLITNNIELDEYDNPLVNKFLSTHFSED
jgi:hypothetical protein